MGEDEEKDQPLLGDSQFELEQDDEPRGGIGRIVIFFGGSLLIAGALAMLALFLLKIGPFEPPPQPLQADVQPAAPPPAPPPPAPPEVKAPEPTVAAAPPAPPPKPAKKAAAKKTAGKKKKKK